MPMERKSLPWGEPPVRGPRPMTLEVKNPDAGSVVRFHRDEQGRVWVRLFEWKDIPPGYWAAGPPQQLTEAERAEMVALLDA